LGLQTSFQLHQLLLLRLLMLLFSAADLSPVTW
jgi:hypothetical protein